MTLVPICTSKMILPVLRHPVRPVTRGLWRHWASSGTGPVENPYLPSKWSLTSLRMKKITTLSRKKSVPSGSLSRIVRRYRIWKWKRYVLTKLHIIPSSLIFSQNGFVVLKTLGHINSHCEPIVHKGHQATLSGIILIITAWLHVFPVNNSTTYENRR